MLRLKSRRRRAVFLLATTAVFLYIGVNAYQVAHQAALDEARSAGVIVIFGAAEYAGKPSPVFRARLDHGLALFRRGLAPRLIVTGGPGGDLEFTEGAVGRDYLIEAGVPETAVIAETISEDTSDSAARVAGIMRANGLRSCVAVSDGYHLYRIKRMMREEGVEAFGSPRPGKLLTRSERLALYLREVLSLTLWRLGAK